MGDGGGVDVFGFLREQFEVFFELFEAVVDILREFYADGVLAFEGFAAGLEGEFGEAADEEVG
jgi:hypothetical protein